MASLTTWRLMQPMQSLLMHRYTTMLPEAAGIMFLLLCVCVCVWGCVLVCVSGVSGERVSVSLCFSVRRAAGVWVLVCVLLRVCETNRLPVAVVSVCLCVCVCVC